MSQLEAYVRGEGPGVLLVHGSACRRDTWLGLFASGLPFRWIAYDRRGSGPEAGPSPSDVSTHAEDVLTVARRHEAQFVVGSSFGAVCVLEALSQENRFEGAVLIEPPLPGAEGEPPVPESFFSAFVQRREQNGDRAAVHFFLQMVLGDGAQKLPERVLARSSGFADQIEADCRALLRFRLADAILSDIGLPVLLCRGEASPRYFASALQWLERTMPHARRIAFPKAGHMLHAEQPRAFGAALASFFEPA